MQQFCRHSLMQLTTVIIQNRLQIEIILSSQCAFEWMTTGLVTFYTLMGCVYEKLLTVCGTKFSSSESAATEHSHRSVNEPFLPLASETAATVHMTQRDSWLSGRPFLKMEVTQTRINHFSPHTHTRQTSSSLLHSRLHLSALPAPWIQLPPPPLCRSPRWKLFHCDYPWQAPHNWYSFLIRSLFHWLVSSLRLSSHKDKCITWSDSAAPLFKCARNTLCRLLSP